ncbi:MAG: YlxR family protein [Chloroflexota bacterium]|nr:YlxR family protein [Chloroflexota bacterium]
MPGSRAPGRVKKQPQRTCVACREVEGKQTLLRLVRIPNQTVELDPTGKKSGRGAYVHASQECAERALGGALSRALKTPIQPEVATELLRRATTEDARE